MYRIYFCLVALFFLGATSMNAQLKIDFSGGTAAAGGTIDVDVLVSDFTELQSVQFSINWDPNVFTYNSIINVTDQLVTFSQGNVGKPPNSAAIDEGQLTVSWVDEINVAEHSLDDGTRLFTIRLNAVGNPCSKATVVVSDEPRKTEISIFNEATNSNEEIGLEFTGGAIDVAGTDCDSGGGNDCTDTCEDSSAVSLIASCETGESDDNICVVVTGRNVSDVGSITTGVSWDPSVLRYTGTTIRALPTALNENDTDQGRLRVVWSIGADGVALNVDDNTALFELCFDVIGSKGQTSDITFVDFPDAIPALTREISDFNGTGLASCYSAGIIEVTDGDGGGGPMGCRDLCEGSTDFTLIASCESGKAGETTCVTFTGRNFTDISGFQAGIRWNNSVLNFKEIVPKALSDVGVNTAEAANGRTQLTWSAGLSLVQLTLDDNTELFDICFDAVGTGGQGSDIEIVDLPGLIDIEVGDADGNSLAFCVSNGEIEIEREQQATPLAISAEDISGMNGSETCMKVTVRGFENIQSVQFNLQWDPAVLSYSQIMDINLPEFGNSNANLDSPGDLIISWNALSSASLADDTDIFSVCFNVIGDPESSTDVSFSDPEISDTDNTVLDPILTGGSITVTGMDTGGGNTDTELTVGNITGDMGEESCLSIRVSDFDNISSSQFTIEWDESVLAYSQVEGIRFPDFNDADAEFISPNRLRIRWNSQTPLTLADNTVLLQVCFNVIGECGNNVSSNIRFVNTGGNSLAFVNSSGTTFTPSVNAGSIRVGDCAEVCNLSVSSDVNDNTCDQRGRIELIVAGENGRVTFDWDNGLSNSGLQTGLRGGTYCVTITDNADCEFTRCYEVEELFFDVEAFVESATCDMGGSITLDIDRIDEDLRLDIDWDAPLRDGDEVQSNLDPSQYCVTVSERRSGCEQMFCYTVRMQNDLSIDSEITPVTNVDGNNGAIALTVQSSDALTYVWSNGETTKDIDGLSADRYRVTITGAEDCEVVESFDVEWSAIFADNIIAAMGGTVSCMGESDGIISGDIIGGCGGNRVYLDGDVVELPIENLSPGSYVIRVDDNCDNADERTIVIGDAIPISASASDNQCSEGTSGSITLDISGGNAPYDLDPSDGMVSGDDMVTDLSPGTLTVLITDANGCEIIQDYVVDDCPVSGACSKARNLISPNGDGVNDEFIIGCLSPGSTTNEPNQLGIYDRWGREVFGATNYDNSWEGTDESGAKLAEGGYMWVLKVDAPGQPRQVYRGTLTLLRSDF